MTKVQNHQKILIENGILRNYMQDRQNARLMKMEPTGNGRRQSYSHYPMPRMTKLTWIMEQLNQKKL